MHRSRTRAATHDGFHVFDDGVGEAADRSLLFLRGRLRGGAGAPFGAFPAELGLVSARNALSAVLPARIYSKLFSEPRQFSNSFSYISNYQCNPRMLMYTCMYTLTLRYTRIPYTFDN